MNNLISRKVLNEIIQDYDTGTINIYELLEQIRNIPTAFDVDKVVEQLESKMFTADLYDHGWEGQTVNNLLCFGDVYEIVKGGGRDE